MHRPDLPFSVVQSVGPSWPAEESYVRALAAEFRSAPIGADGQHLQLAEVPLRPRVVAGVRV